MKVVFDIYKPIIKMNQFKIFIDLTRLKKPIGFMLLFWPCSWGLALACLYTQDFKNFYIFLTLFFLGSVLMRSAGCIVNDIVDRKIDNKIKRTKNRPIAAKKISVQNSLLYVLSLCLFAFIILIQFNKLTILLGMLSMLLAFSYPYMKRITYWPQLFLGLTFNWGIIMAWTSINNNFSIEIIVLYISAIFWTLGYDTIYGAQDLADDEIIGVKSTAIKFKKNLKVFVGLCYAVSSVLILFLFFYKMTINIFSMFSLIFIFSLIYQLKIFDPKDPKTCLKAFKFNNWSGMILFLGLFGLSFNIGTI
jgi:4-hydroxybenzoate polyprenyltransferase